MSLFTMIVDRIRSIVAGVKAEVKEDVAALKQRLEDHFLIGPEAVERCLDARAADYTEQEGQKLDWRHSVVDLLKVIGIDSSKATRAELCYDLGIFTEFGRLEGPYTGSAEQNVALHERLLAALAEHEIRMPPRT